jgi:hypothetical protein
VQRFLELVKGMGSPAPALPVTSEFAHHP